MWTVLEEPVYYSKEQIETFREMKFFSKIGGRNNRPVQPLKARYVMRYQDRPHWSYDGKVGTKKWGEFWPVAAKGKRQSPINLSAKDAVEAAQVPPQLNRPFKLNYETSDITIKNNGHTIQADFRKDAENTITIGEEQYKLLQFHFHYKSEHTIENRHSPMEVHLVHVQEGNPAKLAVIGVMIEQGPQDHKALAESEFWEHLPEPSGHGHQEEKPKSYSFNPASFIPDSGGYFQYQGSLTTPPASENVLWTVMKQPVTFSEKQIGAFKKLFPRNNREVQKPFNRLIQSYSSPGN